MDEITTKALDLTALYGLRIIAALAIFIFGRLIAKLLRSVVKKMLTRKNVEPAVTSFTVSLVYIALLTFVALAALAQLGIQTTSFIAIIGAAGLAVGLALQGSLANFAAGFLLIIFRPFKVGDYIEGAGVAGSVESISIFTTQLKSPDNKIIIIPNAKLTADNIVNYSAKETRRVELVFGIGYGDSIDKAKSIIEGLLEQDGRVLKEPAPTIAVIELAESSVNLVVRPWTKSADYWNVYVDLTENVKKSFDREGISIPFPQRDVHIYEQHK